MILITGASSPLGLDVCKYLHEKGVDFRAAIHKTQNEHISKYTSDIVELDYKDPASIKNAQENIDIILFIAPPNPSMHEMMKNLIDNIDQDTLKLLVKISAYGEEEGTLSVLGSWHQKADSVLEDSSIPYTLLCCMPFMQNILYLTKIMIKPLHAIYLPCGDGRVSHIDLKDIAASAGEILCTPEPHTGKRYVLTGGEALTYADLAQTISEITGKQITYQNIPEEKVYEMMKKIDVSEDLIKAKLVSCRLEKANLRSYVSTHVKDITGVSPGTFKEFVKRYRSFFDT